MSRAYKIRVRETDTRVIRGSDAVSTQLGLLDILSHEEMSQLLAEEVRRRGFEDDGALLQRTSKGTRVTVDPATGTVTVRAESCQTVEVESTRDGLAYGDVGPTQQSVRERLTQQAHEELNQITDVKERQLQLHTTEQLENALQDLKREFDQVINRVTAEALKRKAAQLGHITEIHEDAEAGSLTIRVQV